MRDSSKQITLKVMVISHGMTEKSMKGFGKKVK